MRVPGPAAVEASARFGQLLAEVGEQELAAALRGLGVRAHHLQARVVVPAGGLRSLVGDVGQRAAPRAPRHRLPRRAERKEQAGGTLAGGEPQMLASGGALMARPRLLLLDEPSMGLAPMVIQQIFRIVSEINAQGTTVLLVEQNAQQALSRSHRAYVLETGEVVRSGGGRELLADSRIKEAYLGVA